MGRNALKSHTKIFPPLHPSVPLHPGSFQVQTWTTPLGHVPERATLHPSPTLCHSFFLKKENTWLNVSININRGEDTIKGLRYTTQVTTLKNCTVEKLAVTLLHSHFFQSISTYITSLQPQCKPTRPEDGEIGNRINKPVKIIQPDVPRWSLSQVPSSNSCDLSKMTTDRFNSLNLRPSQEFQELS